MSDESVPPRANRPAWRRPGWLVIGAGVLTVVGLVAPFLPELEEIPFTIRAAFVIVVAAPVVGWVLQKMIAEIAVIITRLQWYDRLYTRMNEYRAAAVEADNLAGRAEQRVMTLSMLVTATLAHPERFHAVIFTMSRPLLQGDDLILIIQPRLERETRLPRPGELMFVVDPIDGKFQGEIEVLPYASLSGERLARVTDFDELWYSLLWQKATAREPYRVEAVAIYVTAAEGRPDG